MRTRTLLLTALALCMTTVALAADVVIPTTDDHPFDITKVEKTGTFTINSSNQIDNTRNGDKATYTLDNQEAMDYCWLRLKTGSQRDDAQLHITITSQSGSKVLDEKVAVKNNGNWNPSVQHVFKTAKMDKGKYTLDIEFISTGTNYVCRVSDIRFCQSMALQVGDVVPLVNPDFEDGNKGWTSKDLNHRISNEIRGNHHSMCENNRACYMSQTFENMPDGLYLLEANACDFVYGDNDIAYSRWLEADSVRTFLFINDQQVLMKTVFDDRINVANIYRWYQGASGNYRFAGNGFYAPSSSGQEAEALALDKGFYKNYLVASVTNGTVSAGWRKTDDNRSTWVSSDNWRLTYISTNPSLQDYANTLKQKPMSQEAKQRLQDAVGRLLPNAVGQAEASARLWADIEVQRQAVQHRLDEKRAHHPQAVAAATAAMDERYKDYTDNQAFNYLYRLQELEERLGYTYYDISVETMGTLGDLLLQRTENFEDVKSLSISGMLNDDDLTVLRSRLTAVVDLDLSATTVPELPDDALSHHPYLTWLVLPSQLKTIGRSCFYEDWSLRSVTMPATLQTIKPYAFYRCYNIGDVVVPEGVTSFGDNVYKESGLQTIVLPTTLQTTGESTFRSCSDLYSVELKALTAIASYAFYGCNHLLTMTLPTTVKTIGEYAFQSCTRLTNIELNEGLTRINREAFYNNALQTVTLPSTLTELYGTPFAQCNALKDIFTKAVAPPQLKNDSPVSGSTPTVHVPVISENVYKQTAKWADLPIVADATLALPQDVYVIGQYNLSWPADVSATYRPNMHLTCTTDYVNTRLFGHVTVNSGAQLNASQLNLVWNQKMLYDYVTRGWFASLINNGTARADQITVEVPMQKDFWYFLTFPFDVRVGDIVCTDEGKVPFVVRSYDGFKRANRQPNDTWVNLGASNVMQAGVGYIFRSTNSVERSTNTFRFTALQNASKPRFFLDEDVEVELKEYASEYNFDRSWNLIGNPYPAFYDIRSMQTTAPITVYEWNQGWWGSTLKYVAYSPQDDNYILNPGQAFFIQRPLEGGPLVFRKDGRQHTTDARPWEYYNTNSARTDAPQSVRHLLNVLLVKDGVQVDRARIVLNESASIDYEPSRDAAKFSSMETAVSELYVVEGGQRLAIDERPLGNGQVTLGLQLSAADTYTMVFDTKSDEEAVLIDHATGIQTALAAGGSYTFQAEAGATENRFTISFGGAVNGVSEIGIDQSSDSKWFDLQGRHVAKPQTGIYVKDGKIVVVK